MCAVPRNGLSSRESGSARKGLQGVPIGCSGETACTQLPEQITFWSVARLDKEQCISNNFGKKGIPCPRLPHSSRWAFEVGHYFALARLIP
eukprot:6896039-Alexandrium_andersonii.AAC.1